MKNKDKHPNFSNNSTIRGLFSSISASPTPYHAANFFLELLQKNGAVSLPSGDHWQSLLPPQKKEPQLIANMQDGTLMAACTTREIQNNFSKFVNEGYIRLWIAHTDSPALKIKNDGEIFKTNCHFLTTETYGGVIDESWLNRSLSIAGRITTKKHTQKYHQQKNTQDDSRYSLIDLQKPLAIIPALAPHLASTNSEKLNRESQLRALMSSGGESKPLLQLLADSSKNSKEDILSYDLFLYPTEPPELVGNNKNLIASRCLDNLAMCHAGISGFLNSTESARIKNQAPALNIVALFNHEEIGSLSFEGASSIALQNFIRRILNTAYISSNENKKNSTRQMNGVNDEIYSRIISRSIAISADMAHPSYFNFPEKNSETHEVSLNKGIVIKRKSALQYATQSFGEAYTKTILENNQIPWQLGIGRSDIRGGTTLGPIVSSRLGIIVADIGSPLLSMHSTREIGGAVDHLHACKFATAFFS